MKQAKEGSSFVDSDRPWIVRLGMRLRQYINPAIRRRSKVGDTPILGNANFPWISDLEADWETIRGEALNILKFRDAIPLISEISPDHEDLDKLKKWKSFFLWGYGYRADNNCERCPKTAQIVERIPKLRTALFSIHEPGMAIAPHKGVTAGICVLHMGLVIPANSENCAIRIDENIKHWEDGKAFVFDDTYEHETWNNTDETRVILLLHFDRPVRFPANLLAGFFMTAIRLSPFVGDAKKELSKWEEAYQALERN